MSEINLSLEDRLKTELSDANIKREVIAILLQDAPHQVAGAFVVASALLKESLNLLQEVTDRLQQEVELSDKYQYIFKLTEHHTKRGQKILNCAKAGHEKLYGTPAEKEAKKLKIQNECKNIAILNPSWNITAIRQQAAENLGDGYGFKTVIRATPDLKTLLNK